METLVRLSFYAFTAATIALVAASACYIVHSVGRVRVRRAALSTGTGTTVTAHSAEFGPGSDAFGRYGTMLGWFAVAFQALAIGLRAGARQTGPTNMFEFSLVFIFALTLMYLVFERSYGVRHLGSIVMPISLAMAAWLYSLPVSEREVDPLIPALQNKPILTMHVSVAIFAYAAFSVAFAAAVLYLIKEHRRISWLPSLDMLDDIGYRAVTIGFPLLALVLILGSVWAHDAWGSYWSWDPKETSSLFLWLIYGVYLHTRTLRGWRGNRSAWILIFGFGATIFTYYGNYFFGGLHAYGGV